MAHNGKRIGEVADKLNRKLNLELNPPFCQCDVELNKGNERYPARQDTDIHEVSMVSAPHRSGPATSRRLDDWRLLGGSPTEPKEHQPQRNQYRHRRGVTDHGPRCVTV